MPPVKSSFLIAFLLLLGGISTIAEARDIDLSFRTGLVAGTITSEKDGTTESFNVGGIPLGLAWHHDIYEKLSGTVQAGVLLDLPNKQLIRQGVDGGVAYHLLGGPRSLRSGDESLIVTSKSDSALSLGIRGGLVHLSATDREKTDSKVSGSAFEIKTGLEYRYELSNGKALMAEAYTTVFSLPASVDLVTPATTEFLLAWRFFM